MMDLGEVVVNAGRSWLLPRFASRDVFALAAWQSWKYRGADCYFLRHSSSFQKRGRDPCTVFAFVAIRHCPTVLCGTLLPYLLLLESR